MLSLKKREQLRKQIANQLSQPKTSLKESPKTSPKAKERKSKEWDTAKGLEFPIYLFDFKGKKIGKASSNSELGVIGVSHVSAATAIKERSMFRGCYLSYNKKISVDDFKPTPVKAM